MAAGVVNFTFGVVSIAGVFPLKLNVTFVPLTFVIVPAVELPAASTSAKVPPTTAPTALATAIVCGLAEPAAIVDVEVVLVVGVIALVTLAVVAPDGKP